MLKGADMDFDEILPHLGDLGRWQIITILIGTYLVDFIAARLRHRRRRVNRSDAAGYRGGELAQAVVLVSHERAQLRGGGERRPVAEGGDPPLQEAPPRFHGEVAGTRSHQPGRGSFELMVADQGSQLGIGF